MDNIINYFNNYNFKDTFDIYKLYDELMYFLHKNY